MEGETFFSIIAMAIAAAILRPIILTIQKNKHQDRTDPTAHEEPPPEKQEDESNIAACSAPAPAPEIRLFRLFLFVAVMGLITSTSFTVYHYYEQHSEQSLVTDAYKQLRLSEKQCWETTAFESDSCEFISVWRDTLNTSAERRDSHASQFSIWLHFIYLIPAASLFTFYAGRWIITGKTYPFIPK